MEKEFEEDNRTLHCIVGYNVRNIVSQANELEIKRKDIVQMFVLGGQVYLVYYK